MNRRKLLSISKKETKLVRKYKSHIHAGGFRVYDIEKRIYKGKNVMCFNVYDGWGINLIHGAYIYGKNLEDIEMWLRE